MVGSVSASQGDVTSGNDPGDTDIQVDLGEIPGNNTFDIEFRVVVNDPLPEGVGSISNQGTVAGSNFKTLLTHAPTISGRDDPTVTLLDTAPLIVAT